MAREIMIWLLPYPLQTQTKCMWAVSIHINPLMADQAGIVSTAGPGAQPITMSLRKHRLFMPIIIFLLFKTTPRCLNATMEVYTKLQTVADHGRI